MANLSDFFPFLGNLSSDVVRPPEIIGIRPPPLDDYIGIYPQPSPQPLNDTALWRERPPPPPASEVTMGPQPTPTERPLPPPPSEVVGPIPEPPPSSAVDPDWPREPRPPRPDEPPSDVDPDWPREPRPPDDDDSARDPRWRDPDYDPVPDWLKLPSYEAFLQQYPEYQGIDYQQFGQQYPIYGGIETPDLPTYMGGQAGAYPTYSPYEGALSQPTEQAILDQLLGRGIGIPLEAEQYQTAMGRITEAERGAQEELTRTAARGGRLESGLYGGQQLDITQQGLEARRQTAQEFAITTAEMQQQAKQAAAPMAMQMMGMGATEKAKAYESLTQRYGAETADEIREYEADYRKIEAEYSAGVIQEQLMYQSQANAWQAYNTEHTKAYEAARQRGLDEYSAQQDAHQAALKEYQTTYQSEVMRAQQIYDWSIKAKQRDVQKYIAELGVQPPSFGDWFGLAVSSFLGGLGQGLV